MEKDALNVDEFHHEPLSLYPEPLMWLQNMIKLNQRSLPADKN